MATGFLIYLDIFLKRSSGGPMVIMASGIAQHDELPNMAAILQKRDLHCTALVYRLLLSYWTARL